MKLGMRDPVSADAVAHARRRDCAVAFVCHCWRQARAAERVCLTVKGRYEEVSRACATSL